SQWRENGTGSSRRRQLQANTRIGAMNMTLKRILFCVALLICILTYSAPAPAQTATVPDITGQWERYGAGLGARADPNRRDLLPPPAPQTPPLKPEYLKQWRDRIQAARDADAKGQPLATNYTHCLPDGMPTMMN